jgi:hypothetical protein
MKNKIKISKKIKIKEETKLEKSSREEAVSSVVIAGGVVRSGVVDGCRGESMNSAEFGVCRKDKCYTAKNLSRLL